MIFLLRKSDIVRIAHSDILFAKSNLSLGEAKYNYEVISLSLLNRTCVANRTEKPQPNSVEVFLGGASEMKIELKFKLIFAKSHLTKLLTC